MSSSSQSLFGFLQLSLSLSSSVMICCTAMIEQIYPSLSSYKYTQTDIRTHMKEVILLLSLMQK